MKFEVKNYFLVFLTLILVLPCSLNVQAQKRLLAARDKIQIVAEILKTEDFFEDDYPSETRKKKEVYLLVDNISSEHLPQIKNVEFVLLTKKQIERMKKTGVEYYSFSRFKIKRKTVQVKFNKD